MYRLSSEMLFGSSIRYEYFFYHCQVVSYIAQTHTVDSAAGKEPHAKMRNIS